MDFEKQESEAYIEFPVIWYKGFTAVLSDGRELPTRPGSDSTVSMTLPADITKGNVTLVYSGTVVQRASTVVSLIGFLAVIGSVVFNRVKVYL